MTSWLWECALCFGLEEEGKHLWMGQEAGASLR